MFEVNKDSIEVKKDKGCIYCEHFYDCIGKPKDVDLCVKFKDRRNRK